MNGKDDLFRFQAAFVTVFWRSSCFPSVSITETPAVPPKISISSCSFLDKKVFLFPSLYYYQWQPELFTVLLQSFFPYFSLSVLGYTPFFQPGWAPHNPTQENIFNGIFDHSDLPQNACISLFFFHNQFDLLHRVQLKSKFQLRTQNLWGCSSCSDLFLWYNWTFGTHCLWGLLISETTLPLG